MVRQAKSPSHFQQCPGCTTNCLYPVECNLDYPLERSFARGVSALEYTLAACMIAALSGAATSLFAWMELLK